MSDRYPAGYTPPYKLLPYFFGLSFGLFFALASALGATVAALNGREPRMAIIPLAFIVGFVVYTIVGIVLVEDGRKVRTGHGRREQPRHFGLERTGDNQLRPWPELPAGVAQWEMIHWLRKVWWSIYYEDEDPVTFSVRSVRDHPEMEPVSWSEKTTSAAKQWVVDRGWLQVGGNGHWELTALGKWALEEIANGRNLGVSAYEHPPTDDDDAPNDGDSLETDMT